MTLAVTVHVKQQQQILHLEKQTGGLKKFFFHYENGRKHIEIFPYTLTLFHSERPKLNGVLAILSAIGLRVLASQSVSIHIA